MGINSRTHPFIFIPASMTFSGPCLFGRTAAGEGPGTEIQIGSGLLLVGNTLTATGGGGGASAYVDLTDAATVDLPTVNTPLASALSTKQASDAALSALAGGSDFVQFTGPATSTKVFTLPNASATLLYSGGALGTPSSGTLTNCDGLTVAGIAAASKSVGGTLTDSGKIPVFNGSGNLQSTAFNVLNPLNANQSGIYGVDSLFWIASATTSLTLNHATLTGDRAAQFPDASGTLVLDTATQTLTNKTLTSPILNVGSDATGDIYYRNSGGTLSRLAVGTNGHVLTLAAGIPSWAAGSGGVSISGTPTTGQAAEWTNATTVQGVAVTGSGSYVKATSPTIQTSLVVNGSTTSGSFTTDGTSTFQTGADWTYNGATLDQHLLRLGGGTAPTGTGRLVRGTSPALTTPTVTTSLTGTGALAVSAGGSNQNLTLSGSGTGKTLVNAVTTAAQSVMADNAFGVKTGAPIGGVFENSQTSGTTAGAFLGMYSNDAAAMGTGDRLGGFFFGGSSSASSLRATALIGGYATENWVDASAYGTEIRFETTDNAGTARSSKMVIGHSGIVTLSGGIASSSTTTGTMVITGGLGVSGAINVGSTATATTATLTNASATASAPNLALVDSNLGIYRDASNSMTFVKSGAAAMTISGSFTRFRSSEIVGWSSTTASTGTTDTSLTRASAGVVNVNNSTTSNGLGSLVLANLTASGNLITTPQALSGAGAVNVTTAATAYTSTGVAQALTLANGTDGQIKTIVHVSRGSGTGTGVLTPTTANGFTTITLTGTGAAVILQYFSTGGWVVLGSNANATVA